jgi:hypothetical protein
MKKSVQIIKVVISKRNFDKLGSEGQYKFTKKVSKLAFPKKCIISETCILANQLPPLLLLQNQHCLLFVQSNFEL